MDEHEIIQVVTLVCWAIAVCVMGVTVVGNCCVWAAFGIYHGLNIWRGAPGYGLEGDV